MAVADPDLEQFRHDLAALIGVAVSDVGMLPDSRHLAGGGPHCGRSDLISIDRFHPPATEHIGSSTEDYTARQRRDRLALDERSSAVDEPDGWRNGGNAAWIRSNNLILQQMQAGDPALAALRAMNYTPDGTLRRRYDTLHPEAGVIPSTDTVTWHTHWEFWRDTLGTETLRRTLRRLLVIIKAAIEGRPVPPEEEDDMGQSQAGIEILADGPTSLSLAPTQAGAADPRPQWLRINNDTGGRPGQATAPDYHLRLMASNGKGGWRGLGANGNPIVTFRSGVAQSFPLQPGEDCVSIQRCGTDAAGKPFDPAHEAPDGAQKPYGGHLTCAIERGAVTR